MNTLKHFVVWLSVPVEGVINKEILQYIDFLWGKRLKPKTINCHLDSIRGFYEYLYNEEEIRIPNPVKRGYALKESKPLPRHLRYEDVDKLFDVIKNLRDRAMFKLMLRCGLRVEEIANLTLGAIYLGLGRYKEAESVYDRILEAARRKGIDELSLTFGKCNLAGVYYGQGRYKEAENLFVETWKIAVQGNEEGWVLNYEHVLADVYRAQGKDVEAERLYRATISRSRPEDGQYALWPMCTLGQLRMSQGRHDDANDLLSSLF